MKCKEDFEVNGHSLNEKSDAADRPQNRCPEGLHRKRSEAQFRGTAKWALALLHALAS